MTLLSRATRMAGLLLLALLVVGCQSSGMRDGRGDPNRLTAAEIDDAGGNDLYTVISRLRPRWMQARSQRTFAGEVTVGVFVNGVRENRGLNILYDIRPNEVQEVEFMSANDAQTRFGSDLQGGAILVTLRR
jgi:hypothetical protein